MLKYGYCPHCKTEGIYRERRMNGNDTCLNGHVYASKDALPHVKPNVVSDTSPSVYATFVGMDAKNAPNLREALMLGGMGCGGEGGEVCDYLKKVAFHHKALDRDKLKEELGDLLWYIFYLMHHTNMTFEEVTQCNITKLCARYPERYGDNNEWI